ncbi:hypothetical protein CHL_0803 [Campylobacter hyointestinalis subsp. lawsonii CCUG 27631]|uniref:hypothetical protein n=1 Tax=Campylobacter hyointestinalis TaxID=198 RepID=UPI0007C98A9A|nr:hypothetical protein [Campylobacter hyointestinalis]ANE34159.1 hypothetical protein CHL_0803 [Campylobacter hyointestinalis subsp. lawsonii CCUG 27631]
MMLSQNSLFSSSRLPGDNFLSGALIGFISSGAFYYKEIKDAKIDPKNAVKKTIKFSLESGIVAGFGISASNNIVRGEYSKAALNLALGITLVGITNKFINTKEDQ